MTVKLRVSNIFHLLICLLFFFAPCSAAFWSINFGFAQLTLPRLLLFITFSGFMLLGGMHIYPLKSPKSKIVRGALYFMFFWFLYAWFSIFWVFDLNAWFRALYFIFFGFLSIFVVIFGIGDLNVLNRIVFAFYLMLVVLNIVGWEEIITGTYYFLSDLDKITTYALIHAPTAWCGNTNDYAILMTLSFFLSLKFLSSGKSVLLKLFYLLLLFSSFALIVFTSSRACLLALILGVCVIIINDISWEKCLMLLLGFTLIAVVLIFVFSDIRDFIRDYIEMFFVFDVDSSGSDGTRWALIKNGFFFLILTVGFGVGAGNIEYWMEHFAKYNTFGITNIHNWWMEILVGYGIFIFVGWCCLFLVILTHLFKLSKKRRPSDANIFFGILCSMGLSLITSSSSMTSEWLWLFLGMMFCYCDINIRNSFKYS